MAKIKSALRNLYLKMVGEEATPAFIARGWAIGMFYGCLIPFGFQLLLSIPTAIILRGSKIGATLGTFISNHFTVFVIYPAQCYVGSKLLGNGLSYDSIKDAMINVIHQHTWDSLLQCGTDLVASFFVGGALFAAVMTPITYFGVKHIVQKKRAREASN